MWTRVRKKFDLIWGRLVTSCWTCNHIRLLTRGNLVIKWPSQAITMMSILKRIHFNTRYPRQICDEIFDDYPFSVRPDWPNSQWISASWEISRPKFAVDSTHGCMPPWYWHPLISGLSKMLKNSAKHKNSLLEAPSNLWIKNLSGKYFLNFNSVCLLIWIFHSNEKLHCNYKMIWQNQTAIYFTKVAKT